MLNSYKIIIVVTVLLLHTFIADAQENSLKWGLSSQIKITDIAQSNGVEDVSSYSQEPVTIGAFVQYKNLNAKLEFLTKSLSVDIRYFVWKKMFMTLTGSWDGHNYEFYFDDYYDCSYIDDIHVSRYMVGLGYEQTILGRLKCQGTVLGGVMHSSKNTESSIVRKNYDSNLRIRKTNVYQLKPSFIYGASLEFELLPRSSKKRLRPIAPFVSLQIAGTDKSRTYRQVCIEEWVEGNIVYQEENHPNDRRYDLTDLDFRFGIKLYFKR